MDVPGGVVFVVNVVVNRIFKLKNNNEWKNAFASFRRGCPGC